MLNRVRIRKYTIIALVFSLLVSLVPRQLAHEAQAAGQDMEVKFGAGTTIGNLSYNADNAFLNFYNNQTAGFRQTETDKDARYDWAAGDVFAGVDDNEASVRFQIRVADNPTLRDLALSGHAEVLLGFAVLRYHSGFLWTRVSDIEFKVDGHVVLSAHTSGGNVYNKSASAIINPNSVIDIYVYGEGDDDGEAAGVRGMYIKFQDKQRPVLSDYTFTGDGAQRFNDTINQQELYVKENENITMTYNFSEPVKPTGLNTAYYAHFLRHPLFVNPPGTGLPAAGQQQYLENITYSKDNLSTYHDKLSFRYTGVRYHESGNLPLEPLMTGGSGGAMPMEQTMEEKLDGAVFADAAGNVAKIVLPNKASSSSDPYLQGKNVNPFDYKRGGFRVIVDAVRPKYTKSGNGIQPEILTGVTLNKGDVVDFTVQMTEEAIIKRGWDISKTFLYFNNGLKAKYLKGSNTKNWTFRAVVEDGKAMETPLLKVIALTSEEKGDKSDINVISDYAGNLLIQPANYEGIHVDGNESLVNSKIDWANLSIDNTQPIIGFRYENGGATDQVYAKAGKVTIDANDPAIKIPEFDPLSAEVGKEKPSKGIYRPSNMTGEASPSVGLAYYFWSKSSEDPFEKVEGDNYAALKRYALSAKQPSEDLYPGKFENVQLKVVNNKTNLLAPPPEALQAGTGGKWYLHVWTADMTWDSARELMQYDKMKEYVRLHEDQYAAWKAEAPGSEADKIFYADNKALAAVGQYGDTSVWNLDDFKHNDSNWVHTVGVLALDNKAPDIQLDSADSSLVKAIVQDDDSGVKTVDYQWVLDGSQPQAIEWKPAALTGTSVSQVTYEDLSEDGKYWLYLKATDNAGNEVVGTPQSEPVVINTQETVPAQFLPEPNPNYEQSHDVVFRIGGVTPDYVGYAFSTSASHPADENAYTAVAPSAEAAQLQAPLSTEDAQKPQQPSEPDASAEEPDTEAPSAPQQPSGDGAPDNDATDSGNTDTNDSADSEPALVASTGNWTLLQLANAYRLVSALEPEAGATGEQGAEAGEEAAGSAEGGSAEGEEAAKDDQLLNALAAKPALSYLVPASTLKGNGPQYVHMLVKFEGKTYFYTQAYYFDHTPPVITFSKTGVEYPLASQSVTVKVTDQYSFKGLVSQYLWVKQAEGKETPAPDASAEGWQPLPADGPVSIDGKTLAPGEVAAFRLYVRAVDGAGNSATAQTESTFKVSNSSNTETPAETPASSLIYLYGDEEDGYTAIVKLDLKADDKAGYEYSISPDDGASWIKWRPYTNFVSVAVPSGSPNELQIQVRYRTPGGKISESAKLDIKDVSLDEQPVYALANLTSTGPVNAADGVDLVIDAPLGIKVVLGKNNPASPVRTGNTFHVTENGFYSFDLYDLNNPDRKDTLYAVVKNVDGTAPLAKAELSNASWTNQNVVAFLRDESEPIVITNNGGKNSYTFTENGTFTFEFKDAAGNVGTAEAKVNNIFKQSPQVKIVRSYQYGEHGSSTFSTLKDANGNVLFSTGVTLEVQKADNSAGNIFVRSEKSVVTMQENGIASFIVQDEYGNTTVAKEQVDNIVTEPPQAQKVVYEFVDENGQPVDDKQIATIGGKKYAKGKVKVTIEGKTTAPNQVFFGTKPIGEDGVYTNKISGADGKFTYSRTFESNGSTLIAISDALGNANKIPVTVDGLDNTAPVIALKQSAVGIVKNKKDFDAKKDLGGYVVSDNLSKEADIDVKISGLDLSKLGKQKVTYTAQDQVGNTATATQDVVVVKDGGLLIFGNDVLISSTSGETALFDTNAITFKVSGYNLVNVGGQDKTNEAGTFDIYYQPGLYREGQLKSIAQKVTYQQLINGQYKITFPTAGWYTIIVRTQERDREYGTFFVGSVN